MGRLPDTGPIAEAEWRLRRQALGELEDPATTEEAEAAAALLPAGNGSCYGLAWVLVRFIESAPRWPLQSVISSDTQWASELRERAEGRGGLQARPLSAIVEVAIARWNETGSGLPDWDVVEFGEVGYGGSALPWDGVYRGLAEFVPRWEQILSRTAKDWVNLVIDGVTNRRLRFVVEYVAEAGIERELPVEAITAVLSGPRH